MNAHDERTACLEIANDQLDQELAALLPEVYGYLEKPPAGLTGVERMNWYASRDPTYIPKFEGEGDD